MKRNLMKKTNVGLIIIILYVLKVTSNLPGATLADFFFFCQENESWSVKVSFPEKNVSKILKRARVIEKKRFFK